MKLIVGIFLAAAAAILCVSFCPWGRGSGKHAINCVGSTSVQPFAEMLSQEFDLLHTGHMVDVQGGGSTAGIQAVSEGIAEIGMCSRSLKDEEAGKFTGIKIAMDGLALVVHKANTVDGLTRGQVRDIFRGQLTNWRQVGGQDLPIRLITREEGSGTREAFVKLVMEAGAKIAAKATAGPAGNKHVANRIYRKAMTQESNGAVKELVRHDRGAIGYMSLGLVKDELKILAIDGVYPSLENVTIQVRPRAITAIIGPSGCGKSTLLRCFNRMNDLVGGVRVAGDVLLDGRDIYRGEMAMPDLRRRVGMVFQRPNPFPLSVFDNVVYGLRVHGITGRRRLEEAVEANLRWTLLWDVLKDKLDAPALDLSPEQQQRLCISRLLAVEPDVLLMDEPCSALDPIATGHIEELMRELSTRYTIVIVTHNMQQAARISQDTSFMLLGDLVESGPTTKIFANPSDKRTEDYVTGRYG